MSDKSIYKTSGEWKKADPSAYATAMSTGVLNKICQLFGWEKNNYGKYWTLEKCKEEALKYTTRHSWQKGKRSGYDSAKINGWLDECCSHMVSPNKPNGYWTKERCLEEALEYKTKSVWKAKNGVSYEASRKNNWFNECTKHMINGCKKK